MADNRSSNSIEAGPDRNVEAEEIRVGWRMAGLAFQVTTEVLAGAILGWLFDWWRGTAPTGLLIGAVAGIAVGLLTLIRGALKLNRQLDAKHPIATRHRAASQFDDDNDDDQWKDD